MRHLPSLRRKIQSAMFQTTFISHLVMACVLIPSLFSLIIPAGQLMTRGSAAELIQKYTMTDMAKNQKSDLMSQHAMASMTESQLIDHIKANNKSTMGPNATETELYSLGESLSQVNELVVDENSTDMKRLLVIVSDQYTKANSFFDKSLPFFKLYTLDFKVDNYQFYLPDGDTPVTADTKNPLNTVVSKMSTTIEISNVNGMNIGSIVIGINGNIISIVVFMYALLMLIVSFGSLFIVGLLSKFMSKGILKPINNVNKQLKSMAEGEFDVITATTLSVKRPPQEVRQLIESANTILIKMHENHQLLEAQNEELHVQNEELSETKGIIQKQQNMLVQNEKMASIGQLSAAIVHEINTPVGAIKSNAQMIEMLTEQGRKKHADPDVHKTLDKIDSLNGIVNQAADRVAGIIKSLKSYSRLDQSEFKASNLNEDLENVLLLTSNLWKNRIKIHENYGDIPMVKCYSGLLNQVFMNLVVNAIDAMESGGELTLSTYEEGQKVIIAIQDTGTGIAAENIERIFEEGFTTKSKNKGSGLGLALSKDVVEKHKGKITVETSLGKGSTFRVIIPIDPGLT